MKLIKTAAKLTNYLNNLRAADNYIKIGFVPTMGALHEGHASLVDQSVLDNDITVCSIFVNPTQFGEKKDLETYPRPIEKDIEILIAHQCDVLFLPEVLEIYPESYHQIVFDLDEIDNKIEGAQRPGHFQGVCNVIKRFFEIVNPNRAYFGQKDFQQTVVVKKLVSLLDSSTEIVVLPIEREAHGLAMSSRNRRLSPEGRQEAAFILQALQYVKLNYAELGLQAAIKNAREQINQHQGAVIEYLLAVNPANLDEVKEVNGPTTLLTVVRFENVRLLDNLIINP